MSVRWNPEVTIPLPRRAVVSRAAVHPGEPRLGAVTAAQRERLSGNVIIQSKAEENSSQPMPSTKMREPVVRRRVLMPAKNREVANSTTQSV